MSKDQNQPAQPVSGVMTDAEFLSKRLARVAKLAGVPMPDFSHEGIAEVAGTILGQIASKLEFDRAQDAAAIRNAALEEAASKIKASQLDQWSMFFHMVRALQSAPAQPIERPDELAYIEACNLAKAIYAQHYREGAEHWRVLPDLRGVISQISNMVAGMTRKQRGNAQEPVAWHIGNADGTMCRLGAVYLSRKSAEDHINSYNGELKAAIVPLYAAAPQVAQEEGARTVIKQCITLAQKRLLEPPSEFREIDFINALGWIRDRLKEVLAAPQPDAQQSSEKGEQA